MARLLPLVAGGVLAAGDAAKPNIVVKDCTYRNTGRFGIVVKASDALIEGCTFEHNVTGIDMGSEWTRGHWLESGNPHRVEIRIRANDLVHANGRVPGPRRGKGIAITTTAGELRDLRIHHNTFIDEQAAITLKSCRDVWIWDNTFTRCAQEVVSDASVHGVQRVAPPVR